MQKDDLVYAGHMLDMARKALDLIRGKNRQDYNSDEALLNARGQVSTFAKEVEMSNVET